MGTAGRYAVLPWIIASVGFPIGGYLGHLVAGPAATLQSGLLSGLVAGVVIGAAQALSLRLQADAVALWASVTGVGLGLALAASVASGPISGTAEAVALGAASGMVVGLGQALVLMRAGIANTWALVLATGFAWAAGWLVTSGIGVAFDPAWPVYGLSGAIVSQLLTGSALWRLVPGRGPLGVPA